MKSDLSFKKLTELVSIASDLNDPVNYFFDMVDNGMLKDGNCVDEVGSEMAIVLKLVEKSIGDTLNLKTHITKYMLQETTKKDVIHGICLLTNGLSATVLYLPEIKIAIVALVNNGTTEFWRLTVSDKPKSFH